MKTTVEIPDALWAEAKAQARQRRQTLRQLVEEGLRTVLERDRVAPHPFRLRDASRGLGERWVEDSWPAIRRIIYDGRGE